MGASDYILQIRLIENGIYYSAVFIQTCLFGREEGIKEGLEKGREEGIQKGREEIATNLKSLGMSFIDIAKATGLTIDEIEQL